MMQCVVLDGNLFDEVVLDELPMISNLCVKDVRMMYLQISSDVTEKRIPVSARKMINMMCHKAYAGLLRRSSICTQKSTCQVAYALLRSKFRIPRGVTMALTHCIERLIIYLVPSRNTIESGMVLTHVIYKG